MEKQGDDVQSTTSRDDILLRSPEREQDDVRKAREQDGVPFNTTATHAMLLKTNARGAMAGDTAEQYPPLSTKLLVGIGLFLAVFLVGLDQTIVATALPKISDHFNSLNDVGWYASAFFLTMYLPQLPSEIARIGLACADCRTALQPTFGKLYQVFNVKTVFLVALAVFELGSLICGLAPTSATLIAGRAIAGSGAAGIVAGAFTVVGYIVPLRQRPIYFASILGANAVASIVGPLAGGAFTDHVTWRWCFYINLPIGAVTAVMIAWFLPVPIRPAIPLRRKLREIDYQGAIFLIPAVVCLLIALQLGGTVDPWNSAKVIGLLVGFGLMSLIFIFIQIIRGDQATIPISVIRHRNVASAACFSAFMGGALFVLIYYIPIYFQAISGSSPTESGLQLLPLLISAVVVGIACGIVVSWWGHYAPFIVIGSAIFTVGAGLLTLFNVTLPNWQAYGFMIVVGSGYGLSLQNAYIAVQVVLPIETLPVGNAIVMFSQTFSGAIFVAVAQSVLSNGLVDGISAKIPDLDPSGIISAGATGIRNIVPPDLLPLVLTVYDETMRHIFIIATVLGGCSFITSLFFEWKSMKGNTVVMV